MRLLLITTVAAILLTDRKYSLHTGRQCINIQEQLSFLYIYTISSMSFRRKNSRYAMFFRTEKASKSRVFDKGETPLRCLPDAIMMLTFFDAVVIAIATCSYRDSNMMLSTCVHVVIKLATRCQFEGASLRVDEVRKAMFCEQEK